MGAKRKSKVKKLEKTPEADVAELVKDMEPARQEMIAQGRTHLEVGIQELQYLTDKEDEMIEEIKHVARQRAVLKEYKVTWLERLCMMMGINAARKLVGEDILLCFADTDGDILNDEEGVPMHQIHTFDDISCLMITVPKK